MNNFIDITVKKAIGFDFIINELSILSSYGKSYLNALNPIINKTDLEKEYTYLEHFLENLEKLKPLFSLLPRFKDIFNTVNNCRNGNILSIVELYEIKMQAILMNELASVFNPLRVINEKIADCTKIVMLLSDNDKFSYDFYLYQSYSKRLTTIRQEKKRIEKNIHERKADKEQLLRERARYVSMEEEEEYKIRKRLSLELSPMMKIMLENINLIGHIDLLLGKAILAQKYQCVKPQITDNQFVLNNMYHPLIKNQVEHNHKQYTKNSIELLKGTTILTGANMSGKTSVIKTVALNLYLAHLGFYLFCQSAKVPLIQGIKYLGIDSNNEVHGLSAFGAEIDAINKIIKEMKQGKYLICIDEFARSTNPSEGEKFVRAFAKFAHQYQTYTLISTHYDGVGNNDMAHYQIEGLKDFSNIKYHTDLNRLMNYSLKKVDHNSVVPKEAYKVASLLEIDAEFKKYLEECYKE